MPLNGDDLLYRDVEADLLLAMVLGTSKKKNVGRKEVEVGRGVVRKHE